MKELKDAMEATIVRERTLLEQCRRIVKNAPKGTLTVRPRKKKTSYYIQTKPGEAQRNITKSPAMIGKMFNKMIAKSMIPICEKRIKKMEGFLKGLDTRDPQDVIGALPHKYDELVSARNQAKLESWKQQDFVQCEKDPESHTHETVTGEMVRSKSEQIIYDALVAAGISFHYEEFFGYTLEDGSKMYPDFTIFLPDGSTMIWEHFGLLGEIGYCLDNGYRINTYHHKGFVIGRDLILTQDDSKGNCSSAQIQQVIDEQILPVYRRYGK